MRIEITNGFVEIRDAVTRKARNAYYDALFYGVNMSLKAASGAIDDNASFPLSNTRKAQEALVTNLIVRVVVDGEEVRDLQRYMDEEISETDYDKIAVACQKIDDPKTEAEKKTKSSPSTAS